MFHPKRRITDIVLKFKTGLFTATNRLNYPRNSPFHALLAFFFAPDINLVRSFSRPLKVTRTFRSSTGRKKSSDMINARGLHPPSNYNSPEILDENVIYNKFFGSNIYPDLSMVHLVSAIC